MNDVKTTADTYAALRSGAAVQPRPGYGVLALGDADRVDFLQRMTTNDVAALRPGESAVTVLTGPTARVQFVFTAVMREQEVWLLPAAGEAQALERNLRGQVFFMDRVQVRARGDLARLRVLGPRAAETVQRALGIDLAGAPEGAWQEAEGALALKQNAYDVPGIEVVLPSGEAEATQARLADAGARALDEGAASVAAYSARRVELGRPLPGAELTGEVNPLEAGLAWACAEDKGCYTGQEIIARQITYDKVTRSLVGLRGEKPLAPGTPLTVQGRVDRQAVGVVTSAAYSPALNAPVALAIVKRPHNAPGVRLDAGGRAVEVATLPFVND
jgi:folate-binding protein YgfZ